MPPLLHSIILLCLLLAAPAQAVEVKEIITQSGVTAWLVREPGQPLIAVKCAFKGAGFAYDPAGKRGRASMASDLLLEGAGKDTALAFQTALENHAIQLGTSVDEDLLYITMQTLSEHKEKAFALLGAALSEPRFDASAIERLRAQTLAKLKQLEQNPDYALMRAWQQTVYGEHPYGAPPDGDVASIRSLGRGDFRSYAQRYLTKKNLIIAIVGDLTEDEARTLLDKNLEALPAIYSPESTPEKFEFPAKETQTVVRRDIPQTLVAFGFPGIERKDPQYFAAFVMNHMLGGGSTLTSRLGKEIREDRGLAYYISTSLDSMQFAAILEGRFATRNDQVAEALKILHNTLERMAYEGAGSEELSDAKRYLTGSFLLNLDSNAEVASYLISMQLYDLGRDYLDKRNSYIEAVTAENVTTIARRLLDLSRLHVVMVGNPSGVKSAP